jgi:hypothetical protein
MPRFKDYVPHGVTPATLLALHDDDSIDERDSAATCARSPPRAGCRRSR